MIHITKLPFARPLALLALLALPLVACGGGDIDDDTDGGTTTDAGTEQPACDIEGFTAVTTYADVYLDDPAIAGDDAAVLVSAVTADAEPYDSLDIEIYEEYGATIATGTFQFEDVTYADCGMCVLIRANCAAQDCETTYYARQGSITITRLDQAEPGRFEATINDAEFVEVTFDDNWIDTPVVGGDTWCLDGYDVAADVTVTAP